MAGLPSLVDRGGQRVKDHDLVAEGQQPVAGMRSDETGTSGDEDLHFLPFRRRSAVSR